MKYERVTIDVEKALLQPAIQYKLREMYKNELDMKRLIALAFLLSPKKADYNDIRSLPEAIEYEALSKNKVDWCEIADIIWEIRYDLGLEPHCIKYGKIDMNYFLKD